MSVSSNADISKVFEEPIVVRIGSDSGQQCYDGASFPLVIESNNPAIGNVAEWIKSNKDWIEKQLTKHGAIMFRNFGITSPNDFNDFVKSFQYDFEEFIGGGGPRVNVVGHVFTSTESPPSMTIPFHHELAYLTHYPSKLAFYCDVPPAKDGETPICLSNRLYQRIAQEESAFIEKLKEKKVRYLRILSSKYSDTFKNDYQRGWEDIFETEDKSIAAKRARETGTDTVEWLEDGSMRVVSIPFDPVKEHPLTKQPIWFNSVVLLHPRVYGSEDKPWRSIYGDYTEMEPESLIKISSIMKEEGVALKWQKGDILLFDNLLALHARNSFTPPRRVLVTMWK